MITGNAGGPDDAAERLHVFEAMARFHRLQRDRIVSLGEATHGTREFFHALVSRSGDKLEGFASFMQRIDATPFRGKKVRLRAKMKSAVAGEAASGCSSSGAAMPGSTA